MPSMLAARPELELSDLDGVRVTLVGGSGAERSGYSAARELFADAGAEPELVGTEELFPTRPREQRRYRHLLRQGHGGGQPVVLVHGYLVNGHS
jgi:hypothetical protein